MASIAVVPRFGCTARSTSVGVEAECSQASHPSVRIPVSSKCATGAAAMRPAITGNTRSMTPARCVWPSRSPSPRSPGCRTGP
jgi:hypothetical protein